MIRSVLAWSACALALCSAALAAEMPSRELPFAPAAPVSFRAPQLAAKSFVRLEPMLEKRAPAVEELPGGRLRVATVRALEKSAALAEWRAVAGGFATRLVAASPEAVGLRVKLQLGTMPGAMELRAQGADGRIESMVVDPYRGNEAWTPWTEGDAQVIELFSPVMPSADAVSVASVLHFTASPLEKAAGTCTVPTSCSTGDTALDAAMAQRKKSVMKIQFVEDGGGFLCSATLLNTERFPAAYVITANHCINNQAAANSLTSLWFFEQTACDLATSVNPGTQVAGGMQIVFTGHNVDSTLLLMGQPPPAGAVYAGWNSSLVANGAPVVSISHPRGDSSRFALGTLNGQLRIVGYPQDMYGVRFSRGIIEGGSSGSGLFTLTSGSLQLRGVLSGTTVRQAGGLSCTNLNEDALYGRFEVFEPQIDQYIRTAAQPADDAPNRAQDLFAALPQAPLDQRAPIALDGRRIDYAGDLDHFRFELASAAYVSAWTEGANLDTVGAILDGRGVTLETNDDAQAADNHFGITRRLDPGTYYVQVGHWDALGTGAYNLRIRADAVDTNYTDLWWNAAESGWGLNLNHQGNILFGTLFTYDTDGSPMWLVMSGGTKQPDGSYLGTLFRHTGAAFNAVPFTGSTPAQVGTMRLTFTGANAGTLTYAVNGVSVTKSITRFAFSTPPTCTWSAFDRSRSDNFQDLWWTPSEPGWGVNVTHQGDILFATLFTYDANRHDLWLVLSNGTKTGAATYSGALHRMRGPAFNAFPWTPATPTPVGTMTFDFTDGNTGTLTYSVNGATVTKQIVRNVFSMPKTDCGPE